MVRRWYLPLLALPVAIGTVVAVLEGVASASPGLTTHAAAGTAAVQRAFPGAPMISPSGGALPGLRNGTVNPTAVQSINWAGFAVTGRRGAFRTVSSAWTEPRVNCTGVRVRRLASFWVGLDGANSGSVEQLGTDADCRGTRPVYFAWWEMFPKPSVNLRTPVRPGDHMSASVTFRGGGKYVLFIKDSTRRWSRTIVQFHVGLARSSAEVITESPALLINGHIVIQNLANFGSVHWTGSRMNGIPLKNILRRIRITMVEVHPPHLIRATTSPVSALDAFVNRYERCC